MNRPPWIITWLLAFALIYVSCIKAHGADTPHKFGWKPSPHGIAGADISTHPLFKVAPLPASASIAQWFYRTDQEQRGACVAFSTAESFDAVHQKLFRGTHIHVSFLDLYQRCLVSDGNFPQDDGTYGGTAIKVLQKGVLLEASWPYSGALDKLPPDTAKIQAARARHIAIKAYALPNDDHGFAIKQCIANLKIAPDIGMYWFGNQFDAPLSKCTTKDANGKTITVQRYCLPMPKGSIVGGHELSECSYDDNMVFPDGNVGGVEIHNHWAGFGTPDKGTAWMPYALAFDPRKVEDVVAIEIVGSTPKKASVPIAVLTP